MNFKNKIILAPLAAVTDIAFRKLCSYYGADIVYSQMIDIHAFIRGNMKLVDFYDEKNVVAQFLGNDAKVMAECAKKVQDKVQAVDINMGCPDSGVVKRGCGSGLMEFPKKISKIVSAVVKAVKVPVTVKIRAGYDKNHINALEIASICEKNGAAAIAVHGRARTINYQTPVDYDIIKKVKETVNIPVIGNGDIFDGKSAKKMFDRAKCDSVMVARGSIGNPQIFNEIKDYLAGKENKKESNKKVIDRYMKYAKKYNIDFINVKKHIQWFTKGFVGGAKYRAMINDAKTMEELKEIYDLFE